ncbi:MAG: NRAMP family divalent metal transporter [Pseudobdellovibrionaceae bacterium]
MTTNSFLKKAASYRSRFKLFLDSIGPGIVAGAADDDPSGIGTYSIAGAQFGTKFLWSALLTWPLMAFVQMACARIGIVTGEGLASALKKKIPRPLMLTICFALFIANTLNVGADLAAMADAAEMLEGGSSHIYVLVFGIVTAWATIYFRYYQIARVLKWLALVLLAYIIAALLIGFNWRDILTDTFIPQLPKHKEEWSMLVAILGTTISPYLFFWQASQEVEEEKASGRNTLRKIKKSADKELLLRKFDVGLGTFFSNLVMYFIILATFLTLYRHGKHDIETSRQAAEALKPLAGKFASLLYTIGLLGVGFLAIPTLTGSAAYSLAETFGWHQGLDAKFGKARAFYAVIVTSTLFGIIFNYTKLNPIKALYWSAVLNGLLAPFLLLTILLVVRDKKLMQNRPSSLLTQIFIAITTLLMFFAAIGMFVF